MVRKRYKIYRYVIFLFIVLSISLAVVFSVVLNGGEKAHCGVNVVIDDRTDGDTAETETESYLVSFISPEGNEETKLLSSDMSSFSRELPKPGEWRIIVEALNSSSLVTGKGEERVDVSPSSFPDVEISVEEVESMGVFSLSVTGGGTYFLRVFEEDEDEAVLEAEILHGSAVLELEDGAYRYLLESSTSATGECFSISDGEKVSVSYRDDGGKLVLEDVVRPLFNEEISVSGSVIHLSDTITVSLERKGNGDEEVTWYLDGEEKAKGEKAEISGFGTAGVHTLLALLRDDDGCMWSVRRTINVHEDGYRAKVGFVVINDEADQGYTMNFLSSMENAVSLLEKDGYDVDVTVKRHVSESDEARDANEELASLGSEIIFNNSYGFEPYMIECARNYPETSFVSITNSLSRTDGLPNTYNAFASIYEGRYLAGIAAGMKIRELIDRGQIEKDRAIVGYVGTYTIAEVISGMTAYYLGVRSVCPEARMLVYFVGTWGDTTLEEAATDALIDRGAVMISQHSDTVSPALAAQKRGVYHTGYNSDMTSIAPFSSIISCRIDWTRYFYTFIKNHIDGTPNPSDWTGTFSEGDVVLTRLNTALAAEGTAGALEKAEAGLRSGSLEVFDTSLFTINGERLSHAYALDTDSDYIPDSGEAVWNGVFHESHSTFQSSPYFRSIVDGITWLNGMESL